MSLLNTARAKIFARLKEGASLTAIESEMKIEPEELKRIKARYEELKALEAPTTFPPPTLLVYLRFLNRIEDALRSLSERAEWNDPAIYFKRIKCPECHALFWGPKFLPLFHCMKCYRPFKWATPPYKSSSAAQS